MTAPGPLWGVQHGGACLDGMTLDGIVRSADVAEALHVSHIHRVLRNPCRVVVSRDAGRTWRPADE